MPTGYTAAIEDGDTSAKSFATRCARAFGAFAHQREDGLDAAPTPVEPKEDSYYKTALEQAEARLSVLRDMTDEEIRVGWHQHVADVHRRNAEGVMRYSEQVAKYQKVADGIAAWQPNEEAQPLKDYCNDQLKISWPYEPYIQIPLATAEEWFNEELNHAAESVDRYMGLIAEEQERLTARREFGIKMLESINDIPEENS